MARIDPLHGGVRTVLVTGAAAGIGLAVAARFVRDGAHVVLTDVDAERGHAAAAALGERAEFVALDVRDAAAWDPVVDRVAAARGLDVVVNNAGVAWVGADPQDPEQCTLDAWRAVHAINLDGVFLGCRAAIRAMRERGGTIVNVASRSGQVGVAPASAYASSKAAVIQHTRSVALHCAARGYPIRCNAVAPGAVDTPLWGPLLGDGPEREARMRAFVASTPLGRFAAPEEVAAAIVWLASSESSYMTGAVLSVDGGLCAGPFPA